MNSDRIERTSDWVKRHSTDPERPEDVDWTARQAMAHIPFEVRGGRPVHPFLEEALALHGPVYGRNGLAHWAENVMVDSIVTMTMEGARWVLLIKRRDVRRWAMPGGRLDPGERPIDGAVRELREETGLYLSASDSLWRADPPRWIRDERGSLESWSVSIVHRIDLGVVEAVEVVQGDDDALEASWWRLDLMRTLTDAEHGLLRAHRPILMDLQ